MVVSFATLEYPISSFLRGEGTYEGHPESKFSAARKMSQIIITLNIIKLNIITLKIYCKRHSIASGYCHMKCIKIVIAWDSFFSSSLIEVWKLVMKAARHIFQFMSHNPKLFLLPSPWYSCRKEEKTIGDVWNYHLLFLNCAPGNF